MTRPARSTSTFCLVGDRSPGLEVLMVPRGHTASFTAGAWVFPGGLVDDPDDGGRARSAVAGAAGDGQSAARVAAVGGHLEESVDGEG